MNKIETKKMRDPGDDEEPKPTNKQKAFVLSYLKHFNAKRAAIEAGYSVKTAQQIGSENLCKPVIMELIEKEFDKLGYATQKALLEPLKIAQSNMGDFMDIDKSGAMLGKPFKELSRDMKGCIKKIKNDRVIIKNPDGSRITVHDKTEFELYDKQKANIDILRIAGKFKDKPAIDLNIAGLGALFQNDPNEKKDNEPEKPDRK